MTNELTHHSQFLFYASEIDVNLFAIDFYFT